jgi:hypothetical protein
MATLLKKMPPPPPIAQNDPVFNRWLHDLTAFISETGAINPGVIPGYDVLISTVHTHTIQISSLTVDVSSLTSQTAVNTSNIATLTSQVGVNTSNIATLFSTTAAHTDQINANAANISALTIRSQVLNGGGVPSAGAGIDGDWFADTVALHIYVKVGGFWILIV